MRIKYNAPTVLSFTLLCAIIMIVTQKLLPTMTETWFMVPGRDTFRASSPGNWFSIITHIFGHKDWAHLISNFTFILVIGPMLEENYGSKRLLIMILVTAFVTGVFNILLFRSSLMGASGVVFMMILLSSFTNFSHGEIPLTFILVLILYMGFQLIVTPGSENISRFAHIVGGMCGSFFGFFTPQRRVQF